MNTFYNTGIKNASAPLYVFLLICSLFLAFVGEQGEPFALPLFYAMLTNGLNLPLSCLFFLLSSVTTFSWEKISAYACQTLFLFVAVAIFRKTGGKNTLVCLPFLIASTAFFVILFPLQSYPAFSFLSPLAQKIAVGFFLCVLSPVFQSALYILLRKLLRCRLSSEEILCLAISFCLVAVGLYKCGGASVYTAVTLFLLLVTVALTKNASALAFAVLFSLPSAVTDFSLVPVALYVLYAGMGMFFLPNGRFPCTIAVALLFTAVQLVNGLYEQDAATITITALSGLLPCVLFLCIPSSALEKWEKKLIFYREGVLSRVAINRNRAAIGEQLFAVANVFRRIETIFSDISEQKKDSQEDVKNVIRDKIERQLCVNCPMLNKCRALNIHDALGKLVSVGCAKGKASLIDLPALLTSNCNNANGVLFCLNQQLAEYRKYRIEAENAQAGRVLIASQAHGVSELLKNIALIQSEALTVYTDKEKKMFVALAQKGVICSEILIYGENEEVNVSLTVYGIYENERIVNAASEAMGMPLLTSEKLVLSGEKFCYTLRKKPRFDAAFGVASRRKQNAEISGDTHSVIRIDEKRFLAAVSDGMGSGKKAAQISENVLSLLESFYRAGMPSEAILSTVNKLLTFNREENFACVDLAAVDLESGRADVVKIGSPLGFIFSGGAIRVLEGDGLPLGMLDELRPVTLSVELGDNDVLLFLSDGVTDAFGSSSDLLDYLKTLAPLNPQALADDVLRAALKRYEGVAKDDMTALAVRVFAA